ncbi:MAG: FMN-binding glutamate synthase family protein [Bryobacterales bacterium]|nr:FMN-binding glutamate synthase family protein [Bryobacterales bacterium]MDE0293328.1 FMN-binding glutamate synthase family protein [Bryobacterales bacterium]
MTESSSRVLQKSGIFSSRVIEDIQTKAESGIYRIRGYGTLRERRWATFDDLTFLPCSLTRIPLEGYREKCETKTVLGARFAEQPIELDIPIMITGMSWGALSYNAKVALAKGASEIGSSNTTGDGGMLAAERANSRTLVYEVLPSRYGIDVHHMRLSDGIELTIGQGAKPGTGGLLLDSKVSGEIARQRELPAGVDQRSPARHPDMLGPDDMIIKIEELREATDWRVPIFVKLGASRVYDDVKLAAKAGADVVVVDGMEGGTGASPAILQEHTGVPTLAAVCEARAALEDMGLYGEVQLIIAGGIRDGVDAAKAMALGADAIYIGTAALIALNCNRPLYVEDYHKLGTEPHFCHHCHTGRCPVGVTTQDPELMKRLPIDEGAERVTNLLRAMTLEIQMLARACGKSDVHHLEPEDMAALTPEASAICQVPLAGTRRVWGS